MYGALGLWTLVQLLAAIALGPEDASLRAQAALMPPRAKAALVVVSGHPAPEGVGGVFVREWDRHLARPPRTLVFADQEGGLVKGFPELPPALAPSAYTDEAQAHAAGRETGAALRRAGVHVDLAPVLDEPDGPLGSRHFREARLGVAFARGLSAGGAGACVKHFPGLGSTAVSTDDRPRVEGVVRASEVAAFRAAVRAGVPCVMTSHAFYPSLGSFRASLEPRTYGLLRELGFDGVAITDSLSIVGDPPEYWPRRAIRAGADMLLFTSHEHARRAIHSLVPLAEAGELDDAVVRVLRWRRQLLADGR